MSVVALFIGGPMDGKKMTLNHMPPVWEMMTCDMANPGTTLASQAAQPNMHKVRYKLYDNCPVKYILDSGADWI